MDSRDRGSIWPEIGNLWNQVKKIGAATEAGVSLFTPNADSTFMTTTAPTTVGKNIVVASFTPVKSGRMLVSANLVIVTSAADTPIVSLYYVNTLTAVTGGTLISGAVFPGNGIVGAPTSTAPAATAGTAVAVQAGSTSVVGSLNTYSLAFASVPVLAVVGVETLISLFGQSNSGSTTWSVTGTMTVVER